MHTQIPKFTSKNNDSIFCSVFELINKKFIQHRFKEINIFGFISSSGFFKLIYIVEKNWQCKRQGCVAKSK